MKIIARFFLYVLMGVLSVVGYDPSPANAQPSLTADQWRSDLRYFKQLVHTKYSNLFHKVTPGQFNTAVDALDKKIGTLSDVQVKVEFAKLVAMFKIGHTALRQRAGSGNDLKPWVHQVPVRFYLFPEGLFIKSIANRYKEALGGKVLKIGKTDAATALEKMRPVIAYENEQGFANMLQYYLNIPEYLQATGIIDDALAVPVTYVKDGKERTITLEAEDLPGPSAHGAGGILLPNEWSDAYEAFNTDRSVLWMKNPSRIRHFEYIPSTKTVYVRHSAVQDEPNETIADFFARIFRFVDSADVDKFILDIRLNGGGNNYLNKPVITGLIASRKINRKGHLFVVTGKATFSAAQNLTNELEKYTEAIFVGEPTSENVNFYGDTRTEVLPESKLNLNLSWLWWQNLDPRDKRQWTAPQLAADMSFDDYKNGIDPAMNVIRDYTSSASIEDQLRELVLQGKYDEAVNAAKVYLKNPLYRYFAGDLETKINDFGYRLMNQNRFEQANKVLNMNVQLFPGSANAYDSYAESFWKLGRTEEAIKYYQLAISKDPHGETGENARKMLEQMKKGF